MTSGTIQPRIPFLDLKRITQSFDPELTEVVLQVLHSGSYIRGAEVKRFEEAYVAYTGCRNCVGVGNGYDALRLIFKALVMNGQLWQGDEVIVPANTYIASILPVVENQLVPVFAEPDLSTFNMSAEDVEQKITSRTRAILVVHLYGRNAMTPEIAEVARKYHLAIVEDNAHAAGCTDAEGRRTGSLGLAGAHSFFPSKNLGALGDGGAVTTNDDHLAETIRTLANYGSARKGYNQLPGVNSRLDELQAAVLRVKLPRLDRHNERRRQLAADYLRNIHHPAVALPSAPPSANEHVWHLFVIRTSQREALQQHLADRSIETLVHYPIPPHKQEAFRQMNGMHFPVTERIHREVLSLPLHPLLDDVEARRVIEAVSAFPAE